VNGAATEATDDVLSETAMPTRMVTVAPGAMRIDVNVAFGSGGPAGFGGAPTRCHAESDMRMWSQSPTNAVQRFQLRKKMTLNDEWARGGELVCVCVLGGGGGVYVL
jgi:hypothetical protein